MIGIEEARERLFNHIRSRKEPWPVETVAVSEAAGRILAESVRAAVSVPHFDNSAMDGFALKSGDTKNASKEKPVNLCVEGTVRAGEIPPPLGGDRTALKIMTGAPIPEGADAVIPKEAVLESPDGIEIFEPVEAGRFIRRRGEDLRETEEAASRGSRISVGTAGLLASVGVRSVSVAVKPRVSILVTGNELVFDRTKLGPGKVLESNSIVLQTALREIGIDPMRSGFSSDDPEALRKRISMFFKDSDVLLITGGVSVGDFDHTKQVLTALGVKELFWSVRQKPGRPLYAGYTGNKWVIGLPGNPYAVFVGFYMFVRPALFALMGAVQTDLRQRKLRLSRDVKGGDGRARWLKGRVVSPGGEYRVEPLPRQASHLLSSLRDADVLILIPEGISTVPAGEEVEVFELP